MKFRKKPVIIEAEQFLEGMTDGVGLPKGVCINETCWINLSMPYKLSPHVHTIHSNQPIRLEFRDWIIPEPDGIHFYPCKPDIFTATYEQVDE